MTPIPSVPRGGDGTIDPATFLQLCGAWPGDPAEDAVSCAELVRAALRGLPAGDPVTRVQTSYSCATSCQPLDPHHGWVIVETGADAVEVEVAQQADGSYGVAAIVPTPLTERQSFDAPGVSAPAIADAPVVVNQRTPLPLCGVESRVAGGPFETAARQCFLDGVRAGSPVEFIAHSWDTEGLDVNTIYRYTGSGSVEVVTNDEGGYWLIHVGIGPAFEPGRVFDLAGLSDRQPIAE
jgi:hypothetical protein